MLQLNKRIRKLTDDVTSLDLKSYKMSGSYENLTKLYSGMWDEKKGCPTVYLDDVRFRRDEKHRVNTPFFFRKMYRYPKLDKN